MTISVASRRSRCRDAQERAGDSEGSIFPYRKGYAAWKRSCLPAVQEQHGDSDVGQLETPRVEVGAVVIPPSLAAWRESVMNGIGHPGGHPALALQDGRIDRRQDRFEHLGQIAGRRSQAFLRALSIVARTASGSVSTSQVSSTSSWSCRRSSRALRPRRARPRRATRPPQRDRGATPRKPATPQPSETSCSWWSRRSSSAIPMFLGLSVLLASVGGPKYSSYSRAFLNR